MLQLNDHAKKNISGNRRSEGGSGGGAVDGKNDAEVGVGDWAVLWGRQDVGWAGYEGERGMDWTRD